MRKVFALTGAVLALQASPALAQAIAHTAAIEAPSPETPSSLAPIDEATLLEAKAVLVTFFPPDKRDEMFRGMFDAMKPQMASMMEDVMQKLGKEPDPGLVKIVTSHFDKMMDEASIDLVKNMDGMIEAIARAYARRFTLSELTQLKQFFSTPTGTKYVAQSTQIMSDPDVANWMIANQKRLAEKMVGSTSALTEEIARYEKKKSKSN